MPRAVECSREIARLQALARRELVRDGADSLGRVTTATDFDVIRCAFMEPAPSRLLAPYARRFLDVLFFDLGLWRAGHRSVFRAVSACATRGALRIIATRAYLVTLY